MYGNNREEEYFIGPDSSKYPRSIFLIIASEFCERFSFCGLRTILSLYLRNVLLFQENEATVVYHVFIMFCYLVPVAGAILADSYLGRYRTILYFSFIYTIGIILMCVAATPPIAISPIVMTYIGLFLIACGSGGIKPCVAAFGGDQFYLPMQQKRLQQFFSIFYFTINFGGFVGMMFAPILRKSFSCFGVDTCYTLGFGFPAMLMAIALLFFLLGKPLYRIKHPKENITLKFINCIILALKRKIASSGINKKHDHWLDYARDECPEKLISDVKIVLAVLYLYLPLPFFWSLFDQQVINPAIVLMLIPLFDKSIYPWLARTRKLHSPLQRMVVGGLFAGMAFIISGIVELKLEEAYPVLPGPGEASLNIINTLNCDVGLIVASFKSDMSLHAGERQIFNVVAHNSTAYHVYLVAPPRCWDPELLNPTLNDAVNVLEHQVNMIFVGVAYGALRLFKSDVDVYTKSLTGRPKIRIVLIRDSESITNVTVTLRSKSESKDVYLVSRKSLFSESAYMELDAGRWSYCVKNKGKKLKRYEASINLDLGAVYLLVLRAQREEIVFSKLFKLVTSKKIHMMWLVPQYIFISIAEVMFAISGLEFSFTQAPNSMKTVTIAAWYVSVALGNLLVIIIIQAHFFEKQANEFFLFAALILINMLIFSLMVARYNYVAMEADSSIMPNGVDDEDNKGKQLLVKKSLIQTCLHGVSVPSTSVLGAVDISK